MMKPSGTGRPDPRIRISPAPFPPHSPRTSPAPRSSENPYTNLSSATIQILSFAGGGSCRRSAAPFLLPHQFFALGLKLLLAQNPGVPQLREGPHQPLRVGGPFG